MKPSLAVVFTESWKSLGELGGAPLGTGTVKLPLPDALPAKSPGPAVGIGPPVVLSKNVKPMPQVVKEHVWGPIMGLWALAIELGTARKSTTAILAAVIATTTRARLFDIV